MKKKESKTLKNKLLEAANNVLKTNKTNLTNKIEKIAKKAFKKIVKEASKQFVRVEKNKPIKSIN